MTDPRPTLSNTVILPTSKDKIFITCAILAGVAGMAFSLNSVGYLLGFNATSLSLYGLIFTVFSLNWITRARPVSEQLTGVLFVIIPIVTRVVFNMAFFQELVASMTATASVIDQVRYMMQVLGIWDQVAVCEEAFRGAELNFLLTWLPLSIGFKDVKIWRIQLPDFEIPLKTDPTPEQWDDLTNAGKTISQIIQTIGWLLFHFLQRSFDVSLYGPYMVWLFVSGLTLGYVFVRYGPGAAVLLHIIINLTA